MTFQGFTLGAADAAGPDSRAYSTYAIDVKIDPQTIKQSLLKEFGFLKDSEVQVKSGERRVVITAKKYQWPTIAQTMIGLDPSTATKVRQIIKESFSEAESRPASIPGNVSSPPAPQLAHTFQQQQSQPQKPPVAQGLVGNLKKSWPWLVGGALLGAAGIWAYGKLKKQPQPAPPSGTLRGRKKRRKKRNGLPRTLRMPNQEPKGSAILRDQPFGNVDDIDRPDA